MWLIVILFALAAVVGLTMALRAFRGRLPPVPSAVAHGLLAASALALLVITVLAQGAAGLLAWALGLFLVAAIGGLILAFGFHARNRSLPQGFLAGHALLGAAGLLLLLAAVMRL